MNTYIYGYNMVIDDIGSRELFDISNEYSISIKIMLCHIFVNPDSLSLGPEIQELFLTQKYMFKKCLWIQSSVWNLW
jgi:hypothetical protein